MSATRLGFDEYDVASQGLISHHYWAVDGKLEGDSMPFRYVWPAELDLMARLAGMSLRERWSGWKREPFTSDSTKHVSVWEKPPARTRPRPVHGGRIQIGLSSRSVTSASRSSSRSKTWARSNWSAYSRARSAILARSWLGMLTREIQRVGDGARAADWDDHRGVADRLADPTCGGGDHRAAAREHLLHQRDTECLHELRPRLAWQYECSASRHQMRLLVVVDIVEEPDPICG